LYPEKLLFSYDLSAKKRIFPQWPWRLNDENSPPAVSPQEAMRRRGAQAQRARPPALFHNHDHVPLLKQRISSIRSHSTCSTPMASGKCNRECTPLKRWL
jgi:hypothetical protein